MVLFTLCFTLGVWLMQQQAALPNFSPAWLLTGLLALLILGRILTQRVFHTLLIAIFAGAAGFYGSAWQAEQRLSSSLPYDWQKRDIQIIGVVANLPHLTERGLRFAFDVEKTLTKSVQVPQHLYLSTYFNPRSKALTLHAGERWQLTVRLKQPHGSSNPHSFDFELWALEHNIRAVGYVHNAPISSHGLAINRRLNTQAQGLFYRIASWREAIRDKFNRILGPAPYVGILTALAIGDQSHISQAQWQLFRRTGVIHLMCISGLHITLISGMGFTLAYWLWRRSSRLTLLLPARKAAAGVALLIALGYALLSGYGVPAQRTVYMVAAVACALWLNRHFSRLQILSIALLGVLFPDPWAILSPGFWLSFAAVSLIFFVTAHRIGGEDSNKMTDALSIPSKRSPYTSKGVLQLIREYAKIQWAITLGLIPLLLSLFGQFSLVSPLANAFAIPLVGLIIVPLTLAGALLPIELPLWLAHATLKITMIPLQYLGSFPPWQQPAPPPWRLFFGILGVLWILMPKGFPSRWLGVLLMLPLFFNSPKAPKYGSLHLIIFDVGQGLAVLAQTQHHALLYDTGPNFSGESDSGNRILIPSLRAMGIGTLDGLMISHDDMDHTGGTASILQAIPVAWISSSQPIKYKNTGAARLSRCADGISWHWDGVKFEEIHPEKGDFGKPHDNEKSCVLRISIGNQHILLTGDIGKKSEQRLLELHPNQLSARLLVVPHHGSNSSSDVAFIEAVMPKYAVFTSGYLNRYGHPKKAILNRYISHGAIVLRSDRDGEIGVAMNASGLTIDRYRQSHHRYWMHLMQTDSLDRLH
ncbi:MAG: DNA internalization-related competence protein ComEC/Rec2, partial [Gallionella sp.]